MNEEQLVGLSQDDVDRGVREHLATLSDEDLLKIISNPRGYTKNAVEYARQERLRRLEPKNPDAESADGGDESSPATPPQDPANLCYVELWRDKNFEGEYLRIDGPNHCPTLRSGAAKWNDSISSLRVGPGAFVEAFPDEGFKGRMVCFGPNQEVPDLSAFGADDQIDSISLVSSFKIFDGLRLTRDTEPSPPRANQWRADEPPTEPRSADPTPARSKRRRNRQASP